MTDTEQTTQATTAYHWVVSYRTPDGCSGGDMEGIIHVTPGQTRQDVYYEVVDLVASRHFNGGTSAFLVIAFSLGLNEL